MTKIQIGAIAAVAIVSVGTIGYLSQKPYPPKAEQTQGAIGLRPRTPAGTLCVQPVSDYSKKNLDLTGTDQVLVNQLRANGVDAKLDAEANGNCAGTVHTEIVQFGGRGRKTAEVEFRLALKDREVPVLSAMAKGKSEGVEKEEAAPTSPARNSFVSSKPGKKDDAPEYQAALAAAYAEQAQKVVQAYRENAR